MSWRVEDTHPQRAALSIVDQVGCILAFVYSSPKDNSIQIDDVWQNDPHRVANARLMAAAPQMMSALKLAHECLLINEIDAPNTIAKIEAAMAEALGGI